MRKKFSLIFGILVASQLCAAQNGYNYPRPEIGITSATAAIPPGGGSGIRPIVGGFSGSSGTTGGGFSTGPTATAVGYNNSPPSVFGFGQGQRTGSTFISSGGSGTGGSGFPATGSVLGVRQPALSQRTGGIYGTGSAGQRAASVATGTNDGQYEGDYSAIPGEPGVSYPIYSEVPPTSFDCSQQPLPGYYSDVEAQCQVFHICALNRTYSFLCPNGTIFSQETLVCVWWNMFNCGSAPSLYGNNAYIYDYGNQGAPTTSAFQRQDTQQLNLGGANRAGQNTFQGTTRSNVQPGSSVFSGNVRPSLSSGSFPAVSTQQVAAAPTAAAAFSTGSSASPTSDNGRRFPVPATPSAVAFPTGPPTTSSAAFGTTIRTGFPTLQDATATFQTGQISPANANREYLPPRRP